MAGYWDRFLKYMRDGPAAIDGWPKLIPATEFVAAVDVHLGSALRRDGFEPVSARRWVRSSVALIRHVVELQALKGVSYCPLWGLSLDFAPHVNGGGEVRWHRTAKSARFDLVYRPIDFEPTRADTREWSVSPLATRQELEEDLQRVAALTARHCDLLFARALRVEDLPALYLEHRARPAAGLPFTAFPQQVLAEAFVAARCDLPNAGTLLDAYVTSYDVPAETARELRRLLEETRGGATSTEAVEAGDV